MALEVVNLLGLDDARGLEQGADNEVALVGGVDVAGVGLDPTARAHVLLVAILPAHRLGGVERGQRWSGGRGRRSCGGRLRIAAVDGGALVDLIGRKDEVFGHFPCFKRVQVYQRVADLDDNGSCVGRVSTRAAARLA
ncbi:MULTISPECIES: hypothetical protein [Stenotrophomonas]|uniref:hypothetical protein n=1 Tax=Stenotrophomonas TaxID=40323 RepID=UPI000F5021C5|nr:MULTISPECIES: hypothetical protein [Stenotrophomonas]AYZ70648.1 hypothetical protein EGY09_11790 [Stenotrophomonas maltophilia]MBH1604150.1 hypothetical protein [Stenotrophomonas maltophilia]MBN5078594.1 hypothetical protein [Stenotrophomonas maltophilia]MDQ7288349.1 hypothetical protein [Stenotrophomonas sp. Sm2128]MDT3473084.1 hypothetical protein [Stenotrophomonas maltophilia]